MRSLPIDGIAIRENASLLNNLRAPIGVPVTAQFQQQRADQDKDARVEEESRAIAAQVIFGEAEDVRQEESTQTPGGSDETCDDAHAGRKAQGNKLEDSSITHAEQPHHHKEQGNGKRQRRQTSKSRKTDSDGKKDCEQHPKPADLI